MVREAEKERRSGQPRSDVERVMAHYGISRDEACEWLRIHPAEILLPERGKGLVSGKGAGIADQTTITGTLLIGGLLGALVGGFLGAIVFTVLTSRQE